jgi:hypothetical protein
MINIIFEKLDAHTPTGRNCKIISGESSVNMNRSNPIRPYGSALSMIDNKQGIDFNL